MPNLTTPVPPALTGKSEEDVKRLKAWGTALIDELTYLFQHLDAGNVLEAASVKAENIDTNSAKIGNAQIGALTADKLTTGMVDTEKVVVADSTGNLEISGSEIVIRDRYCARFIAAYDQDTGKFRFMLCNAAGEPTVSINSGGDAIFSGRVESSSVYSSTIIGTDSQSYAGKRGGVFAQLDPTGIKMMQDKNGVRQQKIGATVSDDGTAYLVLGAGNGEGSRNINGVVYTNGAFKIEKNESYANMGLVGYTPFIYFWEDDGLLSLWGNTVLINGVNVVDKINTLEKQIQALKS